MCLDTKSCVTDLNSEYVDLAAEVFSLLSDPTRIRIIMAICCEELSVNEIAEKVGKSPTATSQHLAKLRWGKVVEARQEANRVYYSLTDEHAHVLIANAVFHAEHVVMGVPASYIHAGESKLLPETVAGKRALKSDQKTVEKTAEKSTAKTKTARKMVSKTKRKNAGKADK